MNIRGTLIALLLTAFVTNSPAAFSADSETVQQRVSLADLNLNDPNGVAVAYGRLLWAARHVCPFADSSDSWLRVTARPCLVQTIGRAVDSIGSPSLKTYARSQPLFRLQSPDAGISVGAPQQ